MEINKKNDTAINPSKKYKTNGGGGSSSLSSSPHKGGFIRNLIPGFIDAGAGTAYVPNKTLTAAATTDLIPDMTSINEIATNDNNNLNNNSSNSNNKKKDVADAIVTNDAEIDDIKNNSRNDVTHEDAFSEAATELHDNRTTCNSNSAALSKRYHSVQSKIVQPKETDRNRNTNRNNNNNYDNDSDNDEKRGGDSDNNSVGGNNDIEVEAKYGFFPSTKPPPSPRPSSFLGGGGVAVKDIDAGSDNDKIIISTDDDRAGKTLLYPRPISPPHVTRKKLGIVKRSSSTAAVVEDEDSRSQNQSMLVAKITSSQMNTVNDENESENENENENNDESDRSSSSNIDRSGDSDNNTSKSALNLKEEEEEEQQQQQQRLHPFPPPRQQTQTQTQQYQPDHSQRPLPFLMKREVSTFSLAPEIGAVVDQEEHQDKLRRWEIKEQSKNQEYQKSGNDDDDNDTAQQQQDQQDQKNQQNQQNQNQRQRIEEKRDTIELGDKLLNKISGNNRRLDKIALQEKDRIEGQEMGGFDSFTNAVFRGNNTNKIKREQDNNDRNNENDDDDNIQGEENEILSSSEVSSTCSEFGTVIQMGDAAIAARLVDIEEMELLALADLREEEEEEEEEEEGKGKGKGKEVEEHEDGIKNDVKGNVGQGGALAHSSSSSLLQCCTSLDLPILESRSFGQDDTIAITTTATPIIVSKKSSIKALHPRREEKQKQQSSSSDEESRTIQHDQTSVKIDSNNYYDKDAKKMTASENASISPNKRKPTASEMVSAAFRRIGPIHSLNKSHGIKNSLSAPTTPPPSHWQKKQPPGSSFEDCERRSPRDGRNIATTASTVPPPPSFVLRSPGSSARISLDAHQVLRMRRQRHDRGVVDQSRTILSPRFSSLLRGRGKGGTTSAIVETPTTDPSAAALPSIPLSPRKAITLPFQLAQKCFSYDNTLSEYSVDDYEYKDNFKNDDNIDERREKLRERLDIPHLGRSTVSQLTPRVSPLESSLSFGGTDSGVGYSSGIHRLAKSFDQGISSHDFSGTMGDKSELLSGQQRQQMQRSPFRQPVSSRKQGYRFLPHPFPADTNIAAISEPSSTVVDRRGRNYSDFSPTKYFENNTLALNSTMELQTPQRIEIEREDALDILACLVERGIADWKTSIVDSAFDTTSTQKTDVSVTSPDDQSKNEDSKHVAISLDATQGTVIPSSSSPSVGDIMSTDKEEKTEYQVSHISSGLRHGMETGGEIDNVRSDIDSALFRIIEDFRKWSQEHDDVARQHSRRMEILDELFKSHAYAVEMKRAASSASTWLKSIGRGQTGSNHNFLGDDDKIRGGEPTTTIMNDIGAKNNDKELNSNKTIDKMEMMTLKATLHSTQLALTETKQVNTNLNEELSKCRAEIGRIKSISRNEQLNRSILDDSHHVEGSSLSASSADCRDERLFHGVSDEDAKERIESTGELDVLVLKSALEKANETIRRLHGELHVAKKGEEIEPTPVVDIPNIQAKPTRSQSTATTPDSSPDHRTVNVRMLDGENFVTDWDDLRTLPPPPDHGLQSPIVRAVLEQWTPDRSLHESLLSWIEEVMKGDDLEGLPPLTISSLDHQVRDGFSMHVLPHLLRRADIHVSVKTRAHRQTTYDMSITVSQKNEFMMGLSEVPISSTISSLQQPGAILQQQQQQQQQWSLLDRRDSQSEDEWARRSESRPSSTESVAHSAVTETIANLPYESQGQPPHTPIQTPRRSPELSPMEYRNFASQLRSRSGSADTFDESLPFRQRQHEHQQILPPSSGTIMGALGGALSGLLSRNKYAASPGRVQSQNDRESSDMLPASLRAQMDLTSSPVPGSSGYHRVGNLESTVSAARNDQQKQEEDSMQPYHRVVSAPPGRIGVTFVEFRGHAMVSDVALDSPLAGWVFPSDILIAVDEIPVSGMRVRDIVKILSTRKDRQRAMRVISSHDMNEFTMMNQVDGSMSEANGES